MLASTTFATDLLPAAAVALVIGGSVLGLMAWLCRSHDYDAP